MQNLETASLCSEARKLIPAKPEDVITFAERCVQFKRSVKSRYFRISLTPWIREPLWQAAMNELIRTVTLRKPVQTGGSVVGEVLMLYWIRFFGGFLQYNWPTKEKMEDRWNRVKHCLDDCLDVAEMLQHAETSKIGEVEFGRMFFRMQGVFKSRYLDSDSVTHQINEELHDWEPGLLAKADGRFTAVKLYKQVNISNAGKINDQFDLKHKSGTMREYQVRCPFCSNLNHEANWVFHTLRTRYEEKFKQLGGLRYDSSGAKVGSSYNYNKIRPTIQLQLPCGGTVHNEDLKTRREMSEHGRYSQPNNTNAEASHESYTYQTVVVHDIDLMTLIKEKHAALSARLAGDPTLWIKYTQERECIPYDPNMIPIVHEVRVTEGLKKSREGLPEPRLRVGTLDRQLGEKERGEFPFWWLLIRDYKMYFGELKSQLVFEGKVETDEQVLGILDEHGVKRWHCCADSGADTDHVYSFCMRNGIGAIKGGKEKFYIHESKTPGVQGPRRIYSPERPLCEMLNCPPMFPKKVSLNPNGDTVEEYDEREPMFWFYAKDALAERHHWLRSHEGFLTPDDVSQDYKDHHDAQERLIDRIERTGEEIIVWYKRKRHDDLLVCERYGTMIWDMSGAMGDLAVAENVFSHDQTK